MIETGKNGRNLDYLQRYVIEEMIEEYQEHHLSRREMVRRVLLITGSIPATASILLAAGCGSSTTPTLAPTIVPTAASVATRTAAATTTVAATTAAATTGSPTSGTSTAARAGTPGGTVTRSASPAGTATRAGSATPVSSGITIPPTDPAIDAGPVEFPGEGTTLKGYRSAPKGVAKAPGILVIHENRGLTEHIKDMTRRYAKDGYLAVAVDLVSRRGGTDGIANPGDIPVILGQGDKAQQVRDLVSGVTYLKGLPNFAGPKAGVVGYCYGGGMAWLTAINSPDIAAAIPYYGPAPDPIDDVQKISGAVLAFYGELDSRINAGQPTVEAAMKKYGKTFEYKIFPGANHAFNNDTGQSYNAAAAKEAYARSLEWFARYLKG